MKYSAVALAVAGMATTVRGHGFLLSPKPRMPGDAFEAACGQQVYYNQGNTTPNLQLAQISSNFLHSW